MLPCEQPYWKPNENKKDEKKKEPNENKNDEKKEANDLSTHFSIPYHL